MIKKYLVGGCVRDEILGLKPKDYDFLIIAKSYSKMKEFLIADKVKIFLEKPEFGIIRGVKNKIVYDYIFAEDIDKDLSRRDFTINSIAKTEDGLIYDPFSGIKDLKNNKLKMVTPTSLSDDPVRIIRALRFIIKFNLQVDSQLDKAILKEKSKLLSFPLDRIANELKASLKINTKKTLQLIAKYDLYDIFDSKHLRLTTDLSHRK